MTTDVSIHFTIKDQSLDDVMAKWHKYVGRPDAVIGFSAPSSGVSRKMLHHCFMPKEKVSANGWSTDLVDALDNVSEEQICWFGASQSGIAYDRAFMLENLAKLGGTAIFIGEIKEGVKEEFEKAKELGINIVRIE